MIAARILKEYRGQKVSLLAPLVVNRKGVYTDLAKWALNKGYWHLRVDGKLLTTRPFPRIDRFKEHTIELPLGDIRVSPKAEVRAAGTARQDAGHRQGRGPRPAGRPKSQEGPKSHEKKLQVFSTKRACRACGRSFPELDPRLFSYNSKHGWCPACYGTGLAIEEVEWTDERARTGAEDHVLDSWIEWLEVEERLPRVPGPASEPRGARRALARREHRRSTPRSRSKPLK